eukprot:gene8271-17020_t
MSSATRSALQRPPVISTLAKTDNRLVELLEWYINYKSRWPPQKQSDRAKAVTMTRSPSTPMKAQVRILHNHRSNVVPDHHSHGQHLDVVQPSQNRYPRNPKLNVIPEPEPLPSKTQG